MTRRVTWGDVVRVSEKAPGLYHPGEIGDVCGLRTDPYTPGVIDVNRIAEDVALIVLVEFSNGKAVEIPESYLSLEEGYEGDHEQ